MPWSPTSFQRFENYLTTSTQTCRVVTDAGKAYLKCLGNKNGPHPLACEWVGTRLAEWLGLPTFECAMMDIRQDDEVPIAVGRLASPGPAFAARSERGHSWGGEPTELARLTNRADIPILVVFDTWTLNCDRFPPNVGERRPNFDNVFISYEREGGPTLIAMDHTHCFTCGNDLTARASRVERVRDPRVYGLFPSFIPFMRKDRVELAVERLKSVSTETVRRFVSEIPDEWQVEPDVRTALIELVVDRAAYVAENIVASLRPACWPRDKDEDHVQ